MNSEHVKQFKHSLLQSSENHHNINNMYYSDIFCDEFLQQKSEKQKTKGAINP